MALASDPIGFATLLPDGRVYLELSAHSIDGAFRGTPVFRTISRETFEAEGWLTDGPLVVNKDVVVLPIVKG